MTDSGDSMIRCEGLTKHYGEVKALENLDLAIGRGQVFGYIGHNGAGKTTTIRILAGLLEATSGSASVAGVDVAADRQRIKSLVGYMPDQFGVYERMRVWEYLDFFGAAFGIPRKRRRNRIDHVLEVTDSQDIRDRFVDTLSRGMKQRIGIARTLVHDPQVLLLDEPASGLDPQARVHMRRLLRRLAESGKTLLVSSHILPELAAVCDLIGILHKGRLRAAGPIGKVLASLRRDRLVELKALAGLKDAAALIAREKSCSQLDESDAASGLLRFSFRGDDGALADLLGRLCAAARVVTLREIPLSLEDAYMAISGIDLAEEPAGPGPQNPEGGKAKA